MSEYAIRRASTADIPTIQKIEHDAAKKFDSIPELSDISSAVVLSDAQIQAWLDDGRIYLACYQDQPIGLISAYPMDTTILVGEVSVIPEHNGKGVGSMLLRAVSTYAQEMGKNVSLMTYREVPWNRAWYARRGFREVEAESLGPKHVEKMKRDTGERGLEREGYTRCCMLWELGEGDGK